MPSVPTPNLRLELQVPGENDNTWGSRLNTAIQLIENAITKQQTLTLAGADVTLTTTNFADDQSRSLCLALNGTLTANVNVIVPTLSHLYLVKNDCSGAFTVTVKTAAGTGVTVPQGQTSIVYADGINVVGATGLGGNADTLDGFDSSAFAKIAARNAYTKGNSDVIVTLADAATVVMDMANGNVFKVTLGGNRTLQIDNPVDGGWVEFYVSQDGTGGRTFTFPANINWEGGSEPLLSTAANARDLIELRYDDDLSLFYGRFTRNISTSGGGVISDIVISENGMNVKPWLMAGEPAGAVTVTILIEQGVRLTSHDPSEPALDLSGFVAGSTIALVNNGYVLGRGGEGGGGSYIFSASDDFWVDGYPGEAGGDAVKGPGAGRTVTIANNGYIWGGGGGGGGGGSTGNSGSLTSGGGGGGGAGMGKYGRATGINDDVVGQAKGNNGTSGTLDSTAANGAGGTGASAGAGASAGTGGNGGDWGTAGSAGAAPVTGTWDADAGAGGAAGKAYNLNGGAAPSFSTGGGAPNIKGAIS